MKVREVLYLMSLKWQAAKEGHFSQSLGIKSIVSHMWALQVQTINKFSEKTDTANSQIDKDCFLDLKKKFSAEGFFCLGWSFRVSRT